MCDLTPDEKRSLETLIDHASLKDVLMALSEICAEKAEHIEANWQDKHLARRWNTMCGAIGVIVPKAVNCK